MFLNAEWAWVGIPVRPGREEEAARFLKSHGLLVSNDKQIEKLVAQLSIIRNAEKNVAHGSFEEDSVRVRRDSPVEKKPREWLKSPEPLPTSWRDVYPIVSQQFTYTTVGGYIFDEINFEKDAWTDNGTDNNELNSSA